MIAAIGIALACAGYAATYQASVSVKRRTDPEAAAALASFEAACPEAIAAFYDARHAATPNDPIVGWRVNGRRTMKGWSSPMVATRSEANRIARRYWSGLTFVRAVHASEVRAK